MNLPNALTLSRIIMIPVFVVIYYLPVSWNYPAACVIFTLAAITDALDGYCARKLGLISALGTFLDPVADKIMVAVALVLLVQNNPSIWLAIPAAIIVGREIAVSALREWMAELGESKKVSVSVYGKLKTVCQMTSLGCLIFHNSLFGIPVYTIGMVLLYIAAILTLWSMFLYLRATWPRIKDNQGQKESTQ